MAEQFYIRIRGRVLGPYDQEKVQSLARRGQFSKMHELSTDGMSWVRASSHPELFTAEIVEPPVRESPPPPVGQSAAGQVAPQPRPQPEPAGQELWYYVKGGTEAVSVDFAGLQRLASTGQLGPDDLVWTQGMQQWVPAKSIQALDLFGKPTLDRGPGGTQGSAMARSGDAAPASVCKAGSDSRPWVLFIAVMGFVYAGLSVVGGLLGLIRGAGRRDPDVVAYGLISVIIGAVAIIGAALLVRYANCLGGLRYGRHFAVLERALEALRSFWIFASIILIIFLAFIVFAIVYAVSVGAVTDW
jgi:hypothetical protein